MRTLLLAAVVLTASTAAAAETNVGTKVNPFTLKNHDGKSWSLADVKDAKAVVVVILGTECPINNGYLPLLAELHKTYAAKGVTFVALNPNQQDSPARIAAHAKQYAVPFPVLKDVNNVIADQLKAERTPEAFLLDGTFAIRYRGRIDDQIGIGFKRPAPMRRDLVEAIEEVLAGKPVSQPTTVVAGCLIGRAPKPKGTPTVTYAKEVSRILQNRCQECHRPGQIGPMSLLTYDDAASWGAMIREVIDDKRMPPWHADPKYGKFTNDRSLPKEERDTLLSWIDQGCPKGDDKALPAAKAFPEGWTIGKPDVVFEMGVDFEVPASAGTSGVKYKYFFVPTNFKEDKWIQAAECKAGNREVVHHIIVYAGDITKRNREDGIGDSFLAAYAPGDMPLVLAPGQAKKVPKNAVLVFQMHYTPNGKETKDRSSVGLIFAKKPPEVEVKVRGIATNAFSIPAGDANHKVTSATTFRDDTLLLSFLPHMHLRGKSFEYQVVYPDGKRETLLSVPKYDFNWQSNYRLEKPLKLPAGTRIECTAHFDNSKDNPNNPDPTKVVRWGDQTWQEMMIGFVDYAVISKSK